MDSGLRRKLAELEEKAEPILHVPGRSEAFAIERVKLVETEAHLLSSGRNSEDLAEMGPANFGTHADPAGLLDHVVHDDLNVRKCLCDASNDGLNAFRSSALPGSQGNVVPRWSEDLIDEIWILVAEGAIKGLHRLALNAKSFGHISQGGHCSYLSVVVSVPSLRSAVQFVQQIFCIKYYLSYGFSRN